MLRMRAKFKIQEVAATVNGQKLLLHPVGADSYGPNGENEDNDFARYTPSGELRMYVTNTAFTDIFKPGDNYYIDFTKAE